MQSWNLNALYNDFTADENFHNVGFIRTLKISRALQYSSCAVINKRSYMYPARELNINRIISSRIVVVCKILTDHLIELLHPG